MGRSVPVLAAATMLIASVGGFVHAARTHQHEKPVPTIPVLTRTYGTQKAVYHVTQANGWIADEHARLLQTIKNHLLAVGSRNMTLRVVLQGGGVDILTRAKTDDRFRAEIDFLRANGVRFLVCRNTLISRKIALDDMHAFDLADLVPAGVSEVTALMQQGFAYLKI